MLKKRTTIIIALLVIFIAGLLVVFQLTYKKSKATSISDTSEVITAQPADYRNCIVLRKEKATLTTKDVDAVFDYGTVKKILPSSLTNVDDLNIIYAKDVPYSNVMKVLDAVTMAKIKNYRLLKM